MLKLIWIDDDNKRIEFVETVNNSDKEIQIDFVNINDKNNILSILYKLVDSFKDYDLLILDEKFTHTKDDLIQNGSSIVEIINKKAPNLPIIGISAHFKDEKNILQLKSIYDIFMEWEVFTQKIHFIKKIVIDSKLILDYKLIDNNLVYSLLGCPTYDQVMISNLISPSIQNAIINGAGLNRMLLRWTYNDFFIRPGLLYDRIWLSTLIGLKEKSLYKVIEFFDKAIYKGIYCDKDDIRWWGSDVKNILYSNVEIYKNKSIPVENLTLYFGQYFNGIEEQDISVCEITYDKFPETVAYMDKLSDKRVQCKSKIVEKHPLFPDKLYYENIYLVKAE